MASDHETDLAETNRQLAVHTERLRRAVEREQKLQAQLQEAQAEAKALRAANARLTADLERARQTIAEAAERLAR